MTALSAFSSERAPVATDVYPVAQRLAHAVAVGVLQATLVWLFCRRLYGVEPKLSICWSWVPWPKRPPPRRRIRLIPLRAFPLLESVWSGFCPAPAWTMIPPRIRESSFAVFASLRASNNYGHNLILCHFWCGVPLTSSAVPLPAIGRSKPDPAPLDTDGAR